MATSHHLIPDDISPSFLRIDPPNQPNNRANSRNSQGTPCPSIDPSVKATSISKQTGHQLQMLAFPSNSQSKSSLPPHELDP
ncbi:hypothetical protein UlMin_008330 [Ulmus minor]